MSAEEVERFLEPPRAGVLATLDAEGWPHLSAMWFVPGEAEVRMWTYSKSQKALNLRRDPRAALLVEDGETYDSLRGVSLRGPVTIVEDGAAVRARGIELYRRYTEPHLGIALEDGALQGIEHQSSKRVGLVLAIEEIASWDHSKLS